MRKIIISAVILMLCPAAIMGYNAYQESSSLDALLLENIEALAEPAAAGQGCFMTVTYDPEGVITTEEEAQEEIGEENKWFLDVIYCGTCDWVPVTSASATSTC